MIETTLPTIADRFLLPARERLNRLPAPVFILFSVTVAMVFSLFFFSPKFWLMQEPMPGTFEWDRASSFLQQCREPFNPHIEAGMRWRLLPPFVAHVLGLTSFTALALPFVGLLCFFASWAHISSRLLQDRLSALLLTLIVAGSGSAVTITNWLGINDGWQLLATLWIVGGRGRTSLLIAGLLGPWIDERFLLGLPLALFCRWWLIRPKDFMRQVLWAVAAILPYILIRGLWSLWAGDAGSVQYTSNAFSGLLTYITYTHLGWWMGLRAAWLLIAIALIDGWQRQSKLPFFAGLVCLLAGWGTITFLASDLTRSTSMLFPVLLWGAVALQRLSLRPLFWLLFIALSNALLPLVLVTSNKTSIIWALPFELIRLFRNPL